MNPRSAGSFDKYFELAIKLGSHSCFGHMPEIVVGPATCPTRQIATRIDASLAAMSRRFSAMNFD
jgi:hypothetical protein